MSLLKLLLAGSMAGILFRQEKAELLPGLVGEYYDIGEDLFDFPSVKDRTPSLRRIDKQVNFLSTGGQFAGSKLFDNFYARWSGLIRIPRDGKYMFTTESDDGSRLYIAGKLVVDNGGSHMMEERSGEVELKAGDHAVKIDFFENGGAAGCKVKWESGEIRSQIIPPEVFFHRRDKELDK